jgi:peptide/nickel transport system ATP-binding protein
VPAAGELPPGCPFADRCGWAIEACRAAVPEPIDLGDGHGVRCIRVREFTA